MVEGVGDHCCEYMTGGLVVVLGPSGLNFGAGMTGGFAFVLDTEGAFVDRYNHELVEIHRLDTEAVEGYRALLRELVREFCAETDSPWGKRVLEDFGGLLGRFWLVKPIAADLQSLLSRLLERAE